MNDLGIWRLIKAGFWLGVGFIVPTLIVYVLGTAGIFALSPVLSDLTAGAADYSDADQADSYLSRYDQTQSMQVVNYSTVMRDGRLLINGVVRNDGASDVTSVQLEAELFNSDGEFVYECSKYLSKKLSPTDTENFQIKCGCKGDTTPEYEKLTVRVISANSY